MSRDDELTRQRALVQALRGGGWPAMARPLPGRDANPPADRQAGLWAYRANAQAIASRALAAAYPVLARLIGDEAMAALARDLWREHPPVRGDLAWFGGELAAWLAALPAFASLAYLPDVARLEWAIHRAHAAADPPDAPPDLAALAQVDPDALRIRFVAGSAAIDSRWPVAMLWRAHQVSADAVPDLVAVRLAMEAGQGESAWVWRRGHRVDVAALPAAEHRFNAELLAGRSLGAALHSVSSDHPGFSFEQWLLRALREGWLAGLEPADTPY